METRLKVILFFVILVVPAVFAALTAKVSFSRAQSVEFCGSCHVMTPWIENVTAPDSDSLAAEHYKRRWIQHDQCFTCHSNYDFLGPIEAKMNGMRHVLAFYLGDRERIELFKPFPNANCLQCHKEAKGFLEETSHDPVEDLFAGKDRCVECHEDVHGVEQPENGEAAEGAGEAAEQDEESEAAGDQESPESEGGHDAAE